jgi:hypothetical protein
MWKFKIEGNPRYDKEGTFAEVWAWMEYQIPAIVLPGSEHFIDKTVIEENGSMTWNEPPYVVSIWDADRFAVPLEMTEGLPEVEEDDAAEVLKRLVAEMQTMLSQMSDFLDRATALFSSEDDAVPIVIDSVTNVDTIPPFVNGIPDAPDVVEASGEMSIPDLEALNAEDAIEQIQAIAKMDTEESVQLLNLLLETEEQGKKRKTVIAAINEVLT